MRNYLRMSEFYCTFAPQKFKQQKLTIMEVALQQNYQASSYHSLDEFADKLGRKLGQHYVMNDIRELLQ